MNKIILTFALSVLVAASVLADGVQLREATSAEMAAGTAGLPAVVTPRMAGAATLNTNAVPPALLVVITNVYVQTFGPGITNTLVSSTLSNGILSNVYLAQIDPTVVTTNGASLSSQFFTGSLVTTFPTNTIVGYFQIQQKFGTTNLFFPVCYTNQ